MIKTWWITGDTHGDAGTIKNVPCAQDPEAAVIILGDVGFNFYLNCADELCKTIVTDSTQCYFYCLRGNHEARPQTIPNIEKIYDEEVKNYVYVEPKYSRIRYLLDFGIYEFNGYRTAIIGGAYSVDKWYRLRNAMLNEKSNDPKLSGWFSDEQLTRDERLEAYSLFTTNPKFDFVLTHTAPIYMRPVDQFLGAFNFSDVDTTMECWLQHLSDNIEVKYAWLMAHYHVDRVEGEHFEFFYEDIEKLSDIAERWKEFNKTNILQTERKISPYCPAQRIYYDSNEFKFI